MIGLALALALVGHPDLDACLARLEAASPSSTTAPALEQLTRAAQRFEACADIGWTRAAIAERAALALSQRPQTCPPPPVCPASDAWPLWLGVATHVGVAGLAGLGGYGLCAAQK